MEWPGPVELGGRFLSEPRSWGQEKRLQVGEPSPAGPETPCSTAPVRLVETGEVGTELGDTGNKHHTQKQWSQREPRGRRWRCEEA